MRCASMTRARDSFSIAAPLAPLFILSWMCIATIRGPHSPSTPARTRILGAMMTTCAITLALSSTVSCPRNLHDGNFCVTPQLMSPCQWTAPRGPKIDGLRLELRVNNENMAHGQRALYTQVWYGLRQPAPFIEDAIPGMLALCGCVEEELVAQECTINAHGA